MVAPGKWITVNEHMSQRAAAYQQQITGVNANQSYLVDGVKFDGFNDGVLLDAKGPGYAWAVRDGEFADYYRGSEALQGQARRQIQAAGGVPIRWHVAEQPAATAMTELFRENRIKGIEVIHTPVVKPKR